MHLGAALYDLRLGRNGEEVCLAGSTGTLEARIPATEMSIHGVSPQLAHKLAEAGFAEVTIGQLVDATIHGFDAELVQELRLVVCGHSYSTAIRHPPVEFMRVGVFLCGLSRDVKAASHGAFCRY
jgi:hypothetical protein